MAVRQRRRPGPANFPQRMSVVARDPSDLTRMLWFLLVVAIGVLAARGAEQTTAGLEGDLVQLVARLPDAVLGFLILGVQVLYLLFFLGIPLALIATRHWRRLGVYTLGWVITVVATTVAQRLVPSQDVARLPDFGLGEEGYASWPPSQAVATSVTALVLLSPQISRPWRRFGWLFVAALAALRVVTSTDVTLDIVLAVGIGGTIGSALLLIFGRRVLLPTENAVLNALDRVGLFATRVERAPIEAAGSLPFTAELQGGRLLHCKVLATGQYRSDSILRRYRSVRVREVGEDVAYASARHAAAVEALLATRAAQSGVRTPRVEGLAPIGRGNELALAFQHVEGERLDLVAAERITDAVLDQAWTAVGGLRSAGIAHRDLQLSSWLLDAHDQLWLIDFSFGEPAASDGALSADIAELLAATCGVVGAERAVASAVRVLGAPTVAMGISHLVPVALSRATRAGLKTQPDGLDGLIEATAAACGVAEPEFAPIERVKPRTLLMAGLLAVAIYVLLPQLTDLPRMIEAIREADPLFMAAALLASFATYVGSALALSGSLPTPIRPLQTIQAAVAATFVGAVAPPGVAHVGLNVRFAQKQGLPSPVAVSATAAKEVAVGVVHVLLLLLMAVIAGRSGALQQELDKLPSVSTVAIGIAILLAVLGVAAAIPQIRATAIRLVVPALRHSVDAIRELLASPVKMTVLFTGALILQISYVAALYFSVHALGGTATFSTIGLIYLTVGSAASVAPTPGGVGAVEAVLLAALTGVGMAAAPALAAVFLYRLVTFWLPIPIGGLTMRRMVGKDLL
jgi:uncharacterized protein (TIRG00374 family)